MFCFLQSHEGKSLQTTSLANLGSSTDLLSIAVRVSRALDSLAELSDGHGLPAADALHLGEELTGGAAGVHVALDVLVDGGALLEDADGVVVGADAVVVVLEGGGDGPVGVHDDGGLGLQLAWLPIPAERSEAK